MNAPYRIAGALLHAVTATHPYRDAIRGDLEEEFARRSTAGLAAAQTWYVSESLRTAMVLARAIPVTTASAARVAGVTLMAYAAIHWTDRAGAEAIWWWTGFFATSVAFRLVATLWLATAAAATGYAVVRMAGGPALVSASAFLALMLAVAVRYIAVAPLDQLWFHAARGAFLCCGAAAGAWLAAASRRVTAS